MALPIRDQAKYWGISLALFLVVLWSLGDVLLPFLIGGALAYFLDPVADRLERLGLSRVAATAVIALLGVVLMILVFLAIIPTLVRQLAALVEAAPDMAARLQAWTFQTFPQLADTDSSLRITIRDSLTSIGNAIKAQGGELANGLLSSAMGLVSFVVILLIVPVVAFYLLLDWDRMVARIDALLPRDHAPTVRRLAREIDQVLAGFVRGQVTVCLILGTYYAVALMVAGLQFGLVVGAIAGTITFIPYIGALVGGALAIGLALFQFWGEWFHIGIIVAIFAIGQFMEGNILTPKLVGNSVGLHPVWLLLALTVFGSLFGFEGMLVAVPLAAALGVLARFVTEQYQSSLLYGGRESTAATAEASAERISEALAEADAMAMAIERGDPAASNRAGPRPPLKP